MVNMKKKESITFQEAISHFFGGVKGLAKQKLPFTCRCGKNSYTRYGEIRREVPIMSTEDCFKHIRRTHGEKIRN
jgi:hypothetical protein